MPANTSPWGWGAIRSIGVPAIRNASARWCRWVRAAAARCVLSEWREVCSALPSDARGTAFRESSRATYSADLASMADQPRPQRLANPVLSPRNAEQCPQLGEAPVRDTVSNQGGQALTVPCGLEHPTAACRGGGLDEEPVEFTPEFRAGRPLLERRQQ